MASPLNNFLQLPSSKITCSCIAYLAASDQVIHCTEEFISGSAKVRSMDLKLMDGRKLKYSKYNFVQNYVYIAVYYQLGKILISKRSFYQDIIKRFTSTSIL